MSKSTISTFELFQMFPDAEAARVYMEGKRWPEGRDRRAAPGARIARRAETNNGPLAGLGRQPEWFRWTYRSRMMTFTIEFGWWLLPSAITVASFVAVYLFGPKMAKNNGGMFPDAVGAIAELGSYLVAVVISLAAWLIWALL